MSLQDESAALRGQVQQALGEKIGVITQMIDGLNASGIVQGAARVGQPSPDFTLRCCNRGYRCGALA
jgi:hypothetical protein